MFEETHITFNNSFSDKVLHPKEYYEVYYTTILYRLKDYLDYDKNKFNTQVPDEIIRERVLDFLELGYDEYFEKVSDSFNFRPLKISWVKETDRLRSLFQIVKKWLDKKLKILYNE